MPLRRGAERFRVGGLCGLGAGMGLPRYNPRLAEPPSNPAPVPSAPARFHGFDALRGAAMLLGILLHAAITYMQRRMDGLLWPLDDQPTSFAFDALFWWIHAWRIPLFFVMAGFFAAMLARRRGPGRFIEHRIKRILIPVAIATVTLLPAMYYIWGWGWQTEGRATWYEVHHVHFDDDYLQNHFRGPAHLWFLNFLVVYSFIYWAILRKRGCEAGGDEPTLPGKVRRLFVSPWRPVIFALPTFLLLLADPSYYLAYHHLLPESLAMWGYEAAQYIYNAVFFLTGVYLYRLHREMQPLQRHAWLYLGLAHVVFVGCVLMIREALAQIDAGGAIDPLLRVGLAASVALFCWLMIWGLTGIGLTVLAKPRGWVRWLSDSAYWVYLVHLPIVALLLIEMHDWSVGPGLRFVLIVAITTVVTLGSYQLLVRYSFIGKLLNGPRTRPGRGEP